MNGSLFICGFERVAADGEDVGDEFSGGATGAAEWAAGDGYCVVNRGGRHPARRVIAMSSVTAGAIARSGKNTEGAISVAGDSTADALAAARDSTGNALEKSYRKTAHALGSAARHVGEALGVTEKPETSESEERVGSSWNLDRPTIAPSATFLTWARRVVGQTGFSKRHGFQRQRRRRTSLMMSFARPFSR